MKIKIKINLKLMSSKKKWWAAMLNLLMHY